MTNFSSVRTNEILPDLPFVNRAQELDILCRFFENYSEEEANIGVLDGESGQGKTELIKQAQEMLSPQHLVVWLPASDIDGRHRDLFESAIYETLCALDVKTKAGRSAIIRHKLVTFVQKLLPSIATDARELSEIGSATLFNVAQQTVASAIRSLGIDIFTIGARFYDLVNLLWKNGIKTIFIVEDLHKRSLQEGQRLIDFIVALDKISAHSPNWSVLATSLPLQDHFREVNGLRPFWQARNRWKVKSWTIGSLPPPFMRQLASLYIENDDLSLPILQASKGNPRQFFDVIQKLSFRNQLTVSNKKVRLPADVGDILNLGNTFEESLVTDAAIRRICAALAIGATNVPIRVIIHMRQTWVGGDLKEFDRRLKSLQASSYVITYTDSSADMWCYLRDDDKRKIARDIVKSNIIEEFEVHRALFEGYVSMFSEQDQELLKLVGDPSSDIPDRTSSIPYIDLYPEACLHAVCGGVPDWHRYAVAAIRLLDHYGRFSELVKFAETIRPKVDAIFDRAGAVAKSVRSLLSKAHYYLRDFDSCIKTMENNSLHEYNKSEIIYYQASSIISAKADPNPEIKTEEILRRVKRDRGVDQDWLPQIVSAHAFALLEKGKFIKAISTYSFFYLRSRFNKPHNKNWHTFAMMSPLFLPIGTASQLCKDAYVFFENKNIMRLAGMALHNLGYCSLRSGNFDRAYSLFDQSDEILTAYAQEEAGFCKTNKAFIHLIRGEGKCAKALSSDALRYFQSPFYIAAARVNLALADWMLGSRKAAAHLDQIPGAIGLDLDPNQSWRIAFNRAFITLHTPGITVTQDLIDESFEMLRGIRATRDAGIFWNNMVAELRSNHPELLWPKFSVILNLPLSFVSTRLASFRASTLCFGHA